MSNLAYDLDYEASLFEDVPTVVCPAPVVFGDPCPAVSKAEAAARVARYFSSRGFPAALVLELTQIALED